MFKVLGDLLGINLKEKRERQTIHFKCSPMLGKTNHGKVEQTRPLNETENILLDVLVFPYLCYRNGRFDFPPIFAVLVCWCDDVTR